MSGAQANEAFAKALAESRGVEDPEQAVADQTARAKAFVEAVATVASAADDDRDLTEEELAKIKSEVGNHTTDEADSILHVDIKADVIELNNLRIFDVAEIDALAEFQCTVLEIRKNLLHDLRPWPENLRQNLLTLDLFDNKLRKIGPFFSKPESPAYAESKLAKLPPPHPSCHFVRLKKLDLSYNQIKRITGLDDLAPTLEELYLVENRIHHIEGLAALTNLRLLELGGNGIREVRDGLATLVNLEELWLGKNKISTITGIAFSTLKKLKKLSLQANRLTALSSTVFVPEANPELAEVYLSENGLKCVENIEALTALELIDFSMNPVPSLRLPLPLPDEEPPATDATWPPRYQPGDDGKMPCVLTPERFPHLLEFWLTDGKVDDWHEVELFAPFSATLRTLYLERNPLENDRRYRDKVYQALPFLTQIDSWPVVNRANLEADRAIRR